MTKRIDQETVFWEAMTAVKELMDDGIIDIERDMPMLYEAISSEMERRLQSNLQAISDDYGKRGADYINSKVKANLQEDYQEYVQLSRKYQMLHQAIEQAEERLAVLDHNQSAFQQREVALKLLVFIGFVIMAMASFGVLLGFTNLYLGATLNEIWTQVYLGRLDVNQPTAGAVMTILFKLLLSAFVFFVGGVLVILPWFAFNWLLAKLPYEYRKPFVIDKYK